MSYRTGEVQKQEQDERNLSVLRSWFSRWAFASYCNYDRISKEIMRDKKDYKLADQKGKYKGPALIIGSGISLEKLIPYIKEWDGPIFCPQSMASTLLYHGRRPEYIVIFDANQMIWEMSLKGYNFPGSTLITHPCISPEVIDKWKHKRLYYLMQHYSRMHGDIDFAKMTVPEVEKIAKEQLLGFDFFENIMPSVYNFIGAAILNAGCVVNNSIEVANFMGYGPLFLCGVDFGFKDWIYRYPTAKKEKGKWVVGEKQIVQHEENGEVVGDTDIKREIKISDCGIPTTEEQNEYKIALMSVYKLDRPQLFDCSDGIITELPKADIKEVVKNHGRGYEDRYRTDAEIVGCADAYFRRIKAIHPE